MEGSPATDFAAAARAFCRDLERTAGDARSLLRSLVRLVDAALSLPHVEPTSEDPAPDPPGLDEDVDQVRLTVASMVGDGDDATVDDVAETYRSVRTGLALFDADMADDAVWEWRFHFQMHWGAHATAAIAALHRVVFAPPD